MFLLVVIVRKAKAFRNLGDHIFLCFNVRRLPCGKAVVPCMPTDLSIKCTVSTRGSSAIVSFCDAPSNDHQPCLCLLPTFLEDVERCSNGVPGVETTGICCKAGCGTCGGDGCSTRALGFGQYDCCVGHISRSGVSCGDSVAAPCIVDAGGHKNVVAT